MVYEDLLDRGAVLDYVAVKEDFGRVGRVEGRDCAAGVFEGDIEGLDEVGGGWTERLDEY